MLEFPLSMLPNTRNREPGWQAWERDKQCKIQKMHFRTKLLTEHVEAALPKHGFNLERRIKAGSPRQKVYQSTYKGQSQSILIVPAANHWVHVSPLLDFAVEKAVVVTFDRPIDSLFGSHDHPDELRVYLIPGKRMTTLANMVLGSNFHRSSENVAVPLLDAVVAANRGNQQCIGGSLERAAELLWSEAIKWVPTQADLSGGTKPTDISEIAQELIRSGQKLVIETGGARLVVDPTKATFDLVA